MTAVTLLGPASADLAFVADPLRENKSGSGSGLGAFLPRPSDGMTSVACELAALMVETTCSQRKNVRLRAAAEERATRAAEAREVHELREKASSIRTHAWTSGLMTMAGGVAQGAGVFAKNEKLSKALTCGGKTMADMSSLPAGLGRAVEAGHDTEVSAAHAAARQSGKMCEELEREGHDLDELVAKALTFAHELTRTQSETALIATRRA